MNYLRDIVHPAAKRILQSRLGFRGGMKQALDRCRDHCRHPVWDEVQRLDFATERDRLVAFWENVLRRPPSSLVEVLWVAPHDSATAFNLRGSSRWSRDPGDWTWFYEDDFDGPAYHSELLLQIMEVADPELITDGRGGPALYPWKVADNFLSLVLYGLGCKEAIRELDRTKFLNGRSDRWFVVGHPDAVYGIILGRLTSEGWRSFRG